MAKQFKHHSERPADSSPAPAPTIISLNLLLYEGLVVRQAVPAFFQGDLAVYRERINKNAASWKKKFNVLRSHCKLSFGVEPLLAVVLL